MIEITLNNGRKMPQLGLGVYKVTDEEIHTAAEAALEAGYRSFDTAAFYRNEASLGNVLRQSGISREDLFITTKVWNSDHGYDKTLKAFETSLDHLGLDYVDLYLIHWPCPDFNLYVDTYRALEKLYKEGRAKSIGVSNFEVEHLERLLSECDVKPAVNQVECHPYFQQKDLKAFCKKHDIRLEAWGPLMQGGAALEDPIIEAIAAKHGKSAAQVILRWHLQEGTIAIPKSVTPDRIRENFQVFDFELSEEEMKQMSDLDKNKRKGRNPNEMHITEIY